MFRKLLKHFFASSHTSVKKPSCKYVPYTSGLFTDAIHKVFSFAKAKFRFGIFSIA